MALAETTAPGVTVAHLYNVRGKRKGNVIRRSNVLRTSLLALALATLTASNAPAQPHFEQLRLVAPAAPGGGWDQTARVMQQALQNAGIVTTPVVENVPGAAGTIGLARFVGSERGNGDVLLVSGLIMLGGIVTYDSPVTLADAVPIARLTGEYEALAVPVASAYRTLDDLLAAFQRDPESISWGGGSVGGSDQILAGLIAAAVGVEPRRVNYIGYSGGGEALGAILGGQVSVGINGLAEFAAQIEAGALRVLAISSAERLPGVDAPTLRERGVDVEFENWRSVVAPPGITADERARLAGAVESMVGSSEWQELLARFRWLDRYLAGEEFAAFAAAEERRVRAILLELGTGTAPGGARAWDPYAVFVLGGLALFGVAAALAVRRERKNAPRGTLQWRPLALIGGGAALHMLLAESLGFIVAAALLFWLVARAFDARHPARDAAFAVGVAVSSYALFAYALQLPLPAGVLGAWL
jgi:putative tricarboxylic transport membrane protein